MRAIEKFASPELVAEVVPAVCAGEKVIAIAMSEPAAGSALTDLSTSAEMAGDEVVISGAKRWCSGGGLSDGSIGLFRETYRLALELGRKFAISTLVHKTLLQGLE